MMTRLSFSVAVIALLTPNTFAEGLLYQLPDDGHWVRFEIDGAGTNPDGSEFKLAAECATLVHESSSCPVF